MVYCWRQNGWSGELHDSTPHGSSHFERRVSLLLVATLPLSWSFVCGWALLRDFDSQAALTYIYYSVWTLIVCALHSLRNACVNVPKQRVANYWIRDSRFMCGGVWSFNNLFGKVTVILSHKGRPSWMSWVIIYYLGDIEIYGKTLNTLWFCAVGLQWGNYEPLRHRKSSRKNQAY